MLDVHFKYFFVSLNGQGQQLSLKEFQYTVYTIGF